MADKTKIEWTDATWNPITGCSVVSPGCTNCYAMKLAGTRLRHIPSRAGLTIDSKAGPVWNGKVRLNENMLGDPLRMKRPRFIFVCAHGDLFHESVPDEWIDRVFAVMALAPQHTFQVLTKRSARMREYLTGDRDVHSFPWAVIDAARDMGLPLPDIAHSGLLRNVWLGVSAEDQARADERIPDLLATPAAIRFISAEPLLGPISFRWASWQSFQHGKRYDRLDGLRCLDWVIVGGESGIGARPMHPAWARAIREQCAAAGVPFFFKQWGAFRPLTDAEHGQACGATIVPGSDPHDRDSYMMATRKKSAGRLLDGEKHSAMPQPREVPAL